MSNVFTFLKFSGLNPVVTTTILSSIGLNIGRPRILLFQDLNCPKLSFTFKALKKKSINTLNYDVIYRRAPNMS